MDNSEKHVRWGEQLEAPPTRRSDGSRPITPIIKRRGFVANERTRSISEPSSPVVHGKFFTFNEGGEKVALLTERNSEDTMNNNIDENYACRTASFLNFEPPKAARHVNRRELKRRPRNNSTTIFWNKQEINDKGNDSVASGTGLPNRFSNSDNADNINWNEKKNQTRRSPTRSLNENFSQSFSKDCPGIMAQLNCKVVNPDELEEKDHNAIRDFLTQQYPSKSPKSPSSPSLSEASSEASRSTAGSEKILAKTKKKKRQKTKTPNVASMLFVADQPSEAENLWKQYCETSKLGKTELNPTKEELRRNHDNMENHWKELRSSYNCNNQNNVNNNMSDGEASPTVHRTAYSDTEASDENFQGNWQRYSLRNRRSPNSKLPVLQAWDTKKERQEPSSGPCTPTKITNSTIENGNNVSGTKLKKSSSFSGTSCSTFVRNERPTVSSIDRDAFIKSFNEELAPIKINGVKDVQEKMVQIKLRLAHTDWEKRCITLKEIRSLIANGATRYDEFFSCLRLLEPSMQNTLKDLRSQVVRETCITLAYMSVKLRSKFDHFAEIILSYLFALIPNAVKVMSNSACTCITFLLENSRSHNVLSCLIKQIKSKSNVIRREGYDFVAQVLSKWSKKALEKNVDSLKECINSGLSDADSEARAHARRGFWAFADHFPNRAELLRRSLDFSKQKLLQGKINGVDKKVTKPIRTRSQSADRSKSRDISHSAKVDTPQRPRQATSKNLKSRRFVQDIFEPESDDAHSESSSLYSNTSFSSHGSRSEDLIQVIRNLDNTSWVEKRDGLVSLRSLLNGRKLNSEELKQVMDCIIRALQEQHAKLFSTILDVIPILATNHATLSNWMHILLVKLILRGGSADVLGSLQTKLWKCLQVLRDTFEPGEQLHYLTKIMIDPSLSLSLRVKEIISSYSLEVVKRIDGETLESLFKDNGVRLAVSKIIMWASEPKSGELRTICCKLITALFDCNPPAFEKILSSMPHSFRQKANVVLKTFVKRATGDENRSPKFTTPPPPPPVVDNGVDDIDFEQLLHNLSNYDLENGERMDHFRALFDLTFNGSLPEQELENSFATILLLIIEVISSKEDEEDLRELALNILNEILKKYCSKLGKHMDLTTKRIIECKLEDNSKNIKLAAEKCLKTLMKTSDPTLLLISISSCITKDLHELNVISLQALKDLIEQSNREQTMDSLSSISPKVKLAYYSPESSVRKCAVVALVAIYIKVGDSILKNYLKDLAPAKMQLLDLYIEKLSRK